MQVDGCTGIVLRKPDSHLLHPVTHVLPRSRGVLAALPLWAVALCCVRLANTASVHIVQLVSQIKFHLRVSDEQALLAVSHVQGLLRLSLRLNSTLQSPGTFDLSEVDDIREALVIQGINT
jgi:hypothetical protein